MAGISTLFARVRDIALMGVSALLLLFAHVAPAASSTVDLPRGGAGAVFFGASRLDMGELNASLSRSGRKEFPSAWLTIGGAGHIFVGRLVLGGEGHMLPRRAVGGTDEGASWSGACGFFDAGYIVLARRGLVVYPLAGVGAGAVNLRLDGRPAASFDDVLSGRGERLRLQRSGFLMNVAVAADRRLDVLGGRLFIGLRLGWVFAPVRSGWELGGREIAGGPDAGWAGPYLRISLGVGGR